MKRIILRCALVCAACITSIEMQAQVDFNNVLNQVKNAAASVSSSVSDGTTASGLTTVFAANKVATKDKVIGNWTYQEPAIVFKSHNFLKNAGGKVVSNIIEKRLQNKLDGYGFKRGEVKMTFDKDGNFTQSLKGKALKGTYAINGSNLVLKYGGQVSQVVGTTQLDGKNLLIVMDASKLLAYMKVVGALSTDATLKTASSFIGSMDGMLCGLRLIKQ